MPPLTSAPRDFLFQVALRAAACTRQRAKIRLVALDVGDVRTGLAATDSSLSATFPECIVQSKSLVSDPQARALLRAETKSADPVCLGVIAGVPEQANERQQQADKTRKFVQYLMACGVLSPQVPVLLVDEGGSTADARALAKSLRANHGRGKRSYVDDIAAAVILDEHLHRNREAYDRIRDVISRNNVAPDVNKDAS